MDLFDLALTMPGPETAERDFLVERAKSCFRGRPTEPTWQWAAREVWLSEKMGAVPRLYDPTLTPWTKEWQELPMNDRGIRVGVVMKDSRSGFTEASLNILRRMPEFWPGGALYAINSREKAREVADKRIVESLRSVASAHLTDDPDDVTLSKISLVNMDIVVSGSGSWGPFMEAWYRLIILDELESHIQDQDTTTYKRAMSRQTDVPDGLLLAMAKPELAGGIIDMAYIEGSQKKYLVPCPRCERLIELGRKLLVYAHCEEPDGWNLTRVRKETFWQCPLCTKPFYEGEKRQMVNSDLARWVPTPPGQRRRPPNGRPVPADPTIESYHMSSYYSLHERNTGGDIACEILKAHVINPTLDAKKYVQINFDGLPWEDEVYSLSGDDVRALIAGRLEERVTEKPDGTKEVIRQVLAPDVLRRTHDGQDRLAPEFHLAYVRGERSARLPFRPALLVITTDKQFSHLKYLVWALLADATPFLIDLGQVQDEDEWLALRHRPYYIEGSDEPVFITNGLIDAGHRPLEVYRACLRGYDDQEKPWHVWPCRGEGERLDKSRSDAQDNVTVSKTAGSRKTFRFVDDWCDGRKIMVRYFNDSSLKDEFYKTHLQGRAHPRPWLPVDVPQQLVNEWTAEKYSESEKIWIHEKTKFGPNDYGDCGKMLYLWLHENREALKLLAEPVAS